MKWTYLFFTFNFIAVCLSAQEIDNTTSFKNIDRDSYIRFSLDNDYFSARDQQYTEGANLELCSPALKKNPLTWLLINPHFSHTRYGLGLEQAGYTPDNLRIENQNRDRPYAGTLFFKTFLLATDTIKKQRWSTTLSTGVIGEIALADEVQDEAHRLLHNVVPPGWDYQIANDVILNYQVDYEKQLLAFRNILSFEGDASARAGTLSDKASIGVTALAGYFESPFTQIYRKTGKFHLYMYDRPELDVIGYDATLEGGVFNHISPYTIPPTDINRVVFINRVGWVASYKKVILEYFQCYTSRELSTGPKNNKWGGVQIAVALR